MKGRHDEALAVLKRMHKGVTDDDEFYLREFYQIKAQIELDEQERLGFGAILRKKSYRHRLILILTFSLFCQLTGVIPLQNYQVVIYQKLGFSQVFSLVLTGIWGTNGCISALVATGVVDKLGRRPLLVMAKRVPAEVTSAHSISTVHRLFFHDHWWHLACWTMGRFRDRRQHESYGKNTLSQPACRLLANLDIDRENGDFRHVLLRIWLRRIHEHVLRYLRYVSCRQISQQNNTKRKFAAGEILPTKIRAVGVACNYAMFNAIVIMLVQVTRKPLLPFSSSANSHLSN